MEKARIDKWLWSVRIFKSRTLATDVCKAGRVKQGDKTLKPSHFIKVGDTIQVRKEGFNLTLQIDEVINKRVSAVLAEPCYTNLTPEEEMNKYKDWFIGKARPEVRAPGSGRPTKRDRRKLEKHKDDYQRLIDLSD